MFYSLDLRVLLYQDTYVVCTTTDKNKQCGLVKERIKVVRLRIIKQINAKYYLCIKTPHQLWANYKLVHALATKNRCEDHRTKRIIKNKGVSIEINSEKGGKRLFIIIMS